MDLEGYLISIISMIREDRFIRLPSSTTTFTSRWTKIHDNSLASPSIILMLS